MKVVLIALALLALPFALPSTSATPCNATPVIDVPLGPIDAQAGDARCYQTWRDGEGGHGTIDQRVRYVHAGDSSTGTSADATLGRTNTTSSDPDLGSESTESYGLIVDVNLLGADETGGDVGATQGHSVSLDGTPFCWTNVDLVFTFEEFDDTCPLAGGWADRLP